MGKIEAVCVSSKKGEKKSPVQSGRLISGHGIAGDAHAGPWHRQVSMLALDDVEGVKKSSLPDLKFGDFAENMVVSAVDLASLGLGSRLQFGQEAVVAITQLGKVCHSRCAIYQQTGDCIMPRLGVFGRVLRGGEVATGDAVEILERVSRDVFQAVVLTVSDRCSRGETVDTAGPAVANRLRESLKAHIYKTEIIPDEKDGLIERLKHYCDGHSMDVIVAVGGTGFALRDVTPEAVEAVIERATPGLDEAMREASRQKTPHAMLSRCKSGIRGTTLVLSVPGSERAAVENIDAVLPALAHGLAKLRGDPSECGRSTSKQE
ncbi:MAG: molybdenum cofactor synthesis domain-containing protein [bacterium]